MNWQNGSNFATGSTNLPELSAHFVEIDDHFKIIHWIDFQCWQSLREIVFSSSSHVKEINGFSGCTLLHRIEFPSSVEVIGSNGFHGCKSLTDVLFSSDSHVRVIGGFIACTSLHRMTFPSSIEVVEYWGFHGCTSLTNIILLSDSHVGQISDFRECPRFRVVILHSGCRVTNNESFRMIRPFIVHNDENVKGSQRLIHLSIFH
jgi:hypothetical protein